MQCFQNGLTYFATVISYDRKMFMKLTSTAKVARGAQKLTVGKPLSCFEQVFNCKLDRFVVLQSCAWHTYMTASRVDRLARVLVLLVT
jgi:hypothetical protein